jgi:O-antigen/teichoic acid export membrane protein
MSMAQAPLSSGRSLFKGAFRGTFLYSIPIVGPRIVSLLLLSIVTRVLTKQDFGMLSLIDQVSAVLGILLCGQFAASLGYFYFRTDSEEERSRVVGTTIGGSFVIGIVAALICWPLMGLIARDVFRTQEALRYLPFVLVSLPFDFGNGAFGAWMRVEDLQVGCAKISILRIALTAAGILVLVGLFKIHVMAYLSTTLGTYVVVTAVSFLYLFRVRRPRISLRLFLPMFRFSVPIALSMIAAFVMNFGDQFILRRYRSLDEVGLYALAYRMGMVVSVAYASFHAYWSAQVFQILQRKDAEMVFARLTTYVVAAISFVSLMLVLGAEPGLHILVARDFRAAAPLIPIITIANAVRSIGEFLSCRFLADGRPGYKTWCDWAGMVVSLGLYFLWIPRLGMWGGAYATLGTFIFMLAISAAATYRVRPFRVEGGRLLKVAAVVAAILALYYAVPVSSLALQIGWSALLLALFPAALWVLRFATPGEIEAARSMVQKVVNWRYSTAQA